MPASALAFVPAAWELARQLAIREQGVDQVKPDLDLAAFFPVGNYALLLIPTNIPAISNVHWYERSVKLLHVPMPSRPKALVYWLVFVLYALVNLPVLFLGLGTCDEGTMACYGMKLASGQQNVQGCF